MLQGLRMGAAIVQNQAEIEMRTRMFVVEAERMAVTCSGRLIVVLQQPKVAASRMRISKFGRQHNRMIKMLCRCDQVAVLRQ